MVKNWLILFILCGMMLSLHAQQISQSSPRWPMEEQSYRGNFFLTDEAIAMADYVIAYQLTDGGWAHGIYYPSLKEEAETDTANKKSQLRSSIEGRSTLAEIHFLSNMYQSSAHRKYRRAAELGIEYLLNSQYSNGGWPLVSQEVQPTISFADNTFIEVMNLMYRISDGRAPYDFISENIRAKCRQAFERGVMFILRTQIVRNGKLTAWCTRYDADSMLPVAGKGQELLGLNSQISDNLTQLLMNLSEPSEAIKQAIEGAISWYQETKISGLTRQNYVNKQGKRDFRFVEDKHAPDMWALYYNLEDNQPEYCELDGTIVRKLDDLSYEGRKSQSWYNNDGGRLLRNYIKWKEAQNAPTIK